MRRQTLYSWYAYSGVKDVLDMLAAGMTQEDILEDYPYLEAEDISAVLLYAARQFDHPVLVAA